MKRNVIVLVIALLSMNAYGQQPVGNGANQLNAGFGLSNYWLPVYIGIDHGLPKNFSVGGELTFRNYYRDRYYPYSASALGIYGNLNYHFNQVFNMSPEWNFYGGINVGFNLFFGNYYTSSTGLGLGAQLGGRYFFNDKFGLNLELGGGRYFSGGKFGITVML